MTPTITMVSLTGREELTEEVIADLNERGGMSGFNLDLFYFAPAGKHKVLNLPDNVVPHLETYGGMIPDFFKIVRFLDESRDWIFLEDDVKPCRNAIVKMVQTEVPDEIGLLSFFDLRHEFKSPGIWYDPETEPMPAQPGVMRKHHLYGAQALKIPARVVSRFKAYALADARFSANWDTWMGLAVEDAGFKVAHYAPSLVQHLGAVSVAYPNTADGRPTAANFPGENFDALGPCEDPIPSGKWTSSKWDHTANPLWCYLHRRMHVEGNRCPKRRSANVQPPNSETIGPPSNLQQAFEQGFEAGVTKAAQYVRDVHDKRTILALVKKESAPVVVPVVRPSCKCPRPGGLREECNRFGHCPCVCHEQEVSLGIHTG